MRHFKDARFGAKFRPFALPSSAGVSTVDVRPTIGGERVCAVRSDARRRLGVRHLLQRDARHPAGGLVGKLWTLAATCASALLVSSPARAIRPFVTDDARVVGHKLAQLETWMVLDRLVLEHNAFAAVGPTDWLEFTVGVTHGGVHSGAGRGYSIIGPLVQAKALVLEAHDNGRPGIAVATGVIPPLGHGPFTPPGWGGFAYLALTESLFQERLLFHANVGIAVGDDGKTTSSLGFDGSSSRIRTLMTAGFGFQARIVAGLHGVAEIYYGDPYDPRTNFPAIQAGFRYIFNDNVQIDGTFGSTLTDVMEAGGHAQTEPWGTLGLRLVTPELW